MRTQFVAAGTVLLLSLGCRDDTDSPTEPAPTTPEAHVTAASALAFRQVSAGGAHSCAVTTDDVAYCWGHNAEGQLGAGTITGPEMCPVFGGLTPCSTRPVLVQGGHKFRQVSAGEFHTCALSADSLAYCWGAGEWLGTGTNVTRLRPVRVVGGHRFRQVDAGDFHTCGVATDGKAYCWGDNDSGQLGDGTFTKRLSPVLVLGGHEFRRVSAGFQHTCGVTRTNRVYCWGDNGHGQLGDSTRVSTRTRPVPVVGEHEYRLVDAGGDHTCAVTTTNRAYCWGEGVFGQLGFGKDFRSRWPRAVVGGLHFDHVTAGGGHTCGETTTNRAYCWGNNIHGELGDGSVINRLTPVAVKGGLDFRQVSAGGSHTCGKTSAAAGYCWGYDFFAQLGDGHSSFGAMSSTPVPVLGPR